VLLAFDQGWPNTIERLTIKRAVKIDLVTSKRSRGVERKRATKLAELEAKEERGALTPHEKSGLSQMRARTEPDPRPSRHEATDVKVTDGGTNHGTVVRGGRRIRQGPAHPNLLRGRNRHFGAKLADPGEAFHEAVEAAIAERVAKRDQ
jgi:hypothetical protein